MQIFALFSGGCMFILLGQQTTFLSLGLLTFILSMCNESFRPANSAAIAQYSTDENKTRSFSLNRLAVNLGWAFGGGLGGLIASVNYQLLFWVDGSTNIIAAILLVILIPQVPFKQHMHADKALARSASAYRDYVFMFFILITVIFGSCFFQIFAMQPVFYKTQWGLSEGFIGLTMTVGGLIIAFFEMVLVHNLEGKKHNLQFISIGCVMVGLGFMLLNVLPAGPAMAMLVSVVVTFGEMMCMPYMSSFWVARTSRYNRGQYAALNTMAWSSAQILGPSIGSQVIEHFGFRALWWGVGSVCLLSALGMRALFSHVKTTNVKIHLVD